MCRYLQIYDFNFFFFFEPFHLVFYMGVNSIRADNLSPDIPRILNKKVANIFGQFLCLQQQFNIFNSWVFYDIRFSPRSIIKEV